MTLQDDPGEPANFATPTFVFWLAPEQAGGVAGDGSVTGSGHDGVHHADPGATGDSDEDQVSFHV